MLNGLPETNSYYHLAFDPGERVGWASFDERGKCTGNGIITKGLYGLSDWLAAIDTFPHVVICETYRVKNFSYSHDMSTVPTIRVIGVLEEFAYKHGAKWVEQEPTVYRDGMRWAGLTVPTRGHIADDRVAIGHGVYWLHLNDLWKIRL